MSKDGYPAVPAHICAACGSSDSLVPEVRDIPFEYRNQRIFLRCMGCFARVAARGLPMPGIRTTGTT